MPPAEVPPIGERIREARVRRSLTVRGLARAVDVSASLISQIETGKSQPSVSTLYAITAALQLPIEDLFAPPDDGDGRGTAASDPAPPHGDADAAAATIVRTAVAATPTVTSRPLRGSRCVGPVVRADGRETIQLESGVTWELLGQVPGAPVEFLRVTYAPGSASAASGELMRHPGTEFGYLVAGELTLSLGFDDHVLAAGDAFSFASPTPHRYRNDGTEPAVGIWFVLEDGPDVARGDGVPGEPASAG